MLVASAWLTVVSSLPAPPSLPPLYKVNAATHLDAGRQHGAAAKARIRGWLATEEMIGLLNFTRGAGRDALENMKRDNTKFSPKLAEELRGIAEGAAVPVDQIWAANMINEIEALMPSSARRDLVGHCSDVYAVPAGGTRAGFAQGHNEDWPGPVHLYWYFLSINSTSDEDGLSSCGGMIYPGGMPGWASSWNANGMWLTQNSLFPARSRRAGLSSAFVQRQAICGPDGGASSLQDVVDGLSTGGWAQAASVNIVDMNARRMANVEVYEDRIGMHEVTLQPAGPSNYSHFNHFKEIQSVEEDGHRTSSRHRQARLDSLPAPTSADDIAMRLSDTHDAAYPIYRQMTLATLVLDGAARSLRVWCCGHSAESGPPAFKWDLSSFFL